MSRLQFLKSLPKKRMSAGVLLFNTKKKLLVLKPSYKKEWTIPGGFVDEYESPVAAAKREVKEEIGLNIKISSCLTVDFVKYSIENEKTESLQILFLAERLSSKQLVKIKLDNKEIIDFKFTSLKDAYRLFDSRLSKRMQNLDKNLDAFVFMENGTPVC